jgi:hypothetical protein
MPSDTIAQAIPQCLDDEGVFLGIVHQSMAPASSRRSCRIKKPVHSPYQAKRLRVRGVGIFVHDRVPFIGSFSHLSPIGEIAQAMDALDLVEAA